MSHSASRARRPGGPATTVSQVRLNVLSNSILPLSSLIAAPILAQTLGTSGRGTVAAAVAPLALGVTVGTVGLPDALTYVIASGRDVSRRQKVMLGTALVAAGFALTAFFWFTSPFLSAGDKLLQNLIVIAAFCLPLSGVLAAFRAVAAGRGAWRLVALERFLSGLFRVASLLVLLLTGSLTVVTATIAIAGTYVVGLLAYFGRWPRNRRGVHPQKADGALIGSYAVRVWIGSLSGILLARLDQTLVLPLSEAKALGLYVVAVNISETTLIFNYAVRDVLFTRQSENVDSAALALSSRISTIVTTVAASAVGAVAPLVVPVLFGASFAASVPVIWLLLLGIVLGNPGSIAGAGLSARGRPGLRSRSLLLACVANIACLLIFVPTLGAIGAALATLVGNALSGAMNVVWLKIYFGVSVRSFYIPRQSDLLTLRSSVRRAIGPKAAV